MNTTPTTTTRAPIPFTIARNESVDLVELIVKLVLEGVAFLLVDAQVLGLLGRPLPALPDPHPAEADHDRQRPAEGGHRHQPGQRGLHVGQDVLAAVAT